MTPAPFAGFEYLAYAPRDGLRVKRLVVLLHGYGRNAHYMEKMAIAAQDAVPDALLLSLHAPEPMDERRIDPKDRTHYLHTPRETRPVPAGARGGAEAALGASMRRQWFRIDGGAVDLMPRIVAVAAHLNGFIDAQRDAMGLQDSDIVLMGFSQGAGLALYTAFSRPCPLGGLVCHSSIIIKDPAQDPAMHSRPPVFYLYGDADPEFPQSRFRDSFRAIQSYIGDRAQEAVIGGLGHYTNAESRAACAAFIGRVFTP